MTTKKADGFLPNVLDVRTVGIGGGSMVELSKGKAVGTGPRSAHIAGLAYEIYSDTEDIVNPRLTELHPKESDPAYACIECDNGVKLALTLTGAANIAGFVEEGDYACGNVEAARKAWQPLADSMGCTIEAAAEKVLDFATEKNGKVVSQLIKEYDMNPRTTVFVGGGGGASCAVAHLAKTLGHKYRPAQNAPVISTIGVALAMVRDMVERTVIDPTDSDIISIRREAELQAIRNGAAPETVEVSVSVDLQRNLVRAVAVGATEMHSKDLMNRKLSCEQILSIAAENLNVDVTQLFISAETKSMFAVQCDYIEKKMFGLMRKKTKPLRLIDEEGVIRLQRNNAVTLSGTVGNWREKVDFSLEELTVYDDSGTSIPNVHVVLGRKIIDMSGLTSADQLYSIGAVELSGYDPEEPIIVLATYRSAN